MATAHIPKGTTGIVGTLGMVHGGEVLISVRELELVRKLQQAIDEAPELEPELEARGEQA